jgi:pyrroline-5-carboxylate reductase
MNKIGFIGGGKMATAIMNGIISSGYCKSENIFVSDKNEQALTVLKEKNKVNTTFDNAEVVKNCNIIFFAVKPFFLRDVLNEIKPYITENHLVLSIAAGISIKTIEEIIGSIPVVRIMPNTPALVNAGMSAICGGTYAKEVHKKIALDIFKSVGEVIEAEEKYIDIITAISGSGPAFYYYVIDEIAKAGEKLGLDYKTCLKLSAQTALGSAKMVMETDVSPEQLIINVTTPGGCTAVGNDVLKENNISGIMFETIEKTAKKAYELGK